MTWRTLLTYAKNRLRQAGIPDPEYDAWALFSFVFHMEKGYYFLHDNDRIEASKKERLEEVLSLRAKRIPLQQILHSAWFMGYEFYVNEHVLIPRFDTEILAEEALLRLRPGMQILDMCTGSGCILLSLLLRHTDWNLRGIGVDLSAEALQTARRNQQRLQVEAEWIQSDLFAHVTGVFDMIVSNPPYIASAEIGNLMPEVRDHEPRMALDGDTDGLHFYREIIKEAKNYLKAGGWLCMEIGYDQAEAVKSLLEREDYRDISVRQDLAGLDRVVCAGK